MSAVYIGCGADITPIQQFDAIIRHFVYIDSLPYCEWDEGEHALPLRTSFVPTFLEKMNSIGYALTVPLPEIRDVPETIYLKFDKKNMHDENVVVDCYFNTPFPALRPSYQLEIYGKIARASYLIDVGHHPDASILQLMKEFTLLVNTNTIYSYDPEDDENVIKHLYEHPEEQKKIRNVLVYHPDKLVVTTFPNIHSIIKKVVDTYGPDKRYCPNSI